MTNGYMVYLLRILAAQGALASVYTDPEDPEGFSAGFVEAVDGQHVLMCDLSPWGQIDGWRVRRNQDVIQVLAGEEYEQRLAMLLAYHKQHHRCFFTEAPAEDTDLLLSVLIACKERGEIVSVIMGDDMITGRVLEANGLRLKLRLLDFFGREAEEETVTLREIEILEIATQEEQMYAVLEEMARQEMTLLAPDPRRTNENHDFDHLSGDVYPAAYEYARPRGKSGNSGYPRGGYPRLFPKQAP